MNFREKWGKRTILGLFLPKIKHFMQFYKVYGMKMLLA